MALHLKRVQYFTDHLRCRISNEIIRHGDYYYEDDIDGFVVKASVYGEMRKKKKEDEFDYSKLNNAENMRDYQAQLKEYERAFLEQSLFERKLFTEEEGF